MNNRYKSTILFFTLISFLASCNIKENINNALTFKIQESTSFTIPSSSIVNLPIDIGTPDIQSSGQQAFENNNTSAKLVEEITLSSLEMTITSPADRTFSFVKSMKIYIRTNDSNEVLLAEKQNVDSNIGSTLSLDATGENLKTYLSSDTYSLRYEVVTKETTNSETDITADMEFTVRAKVL